MSKRYPLVDTIRGFAVLAMMVYHFGFDLNMQGFIVQDLNNSKPWLVSRSIILGTFLFVSGFSFALARDHSTQYRLTRLARIAGCALLVSLASYFMFPGSWIFFGVLHFVVVATLICWLLLNQENLWLPLGLIVLGMGLYYQSDIFDQPRLQWLGMMTHKPVTEDYVPVFPWIGIMLIGLDAGNRFIRTKWDFLIKDSQPSGLRPINWLGRHSLVVYMLHQPLLLALLWCFGVIYR